MVPIVRLYKLFSHFSFDTVGAKEKLSKENAVKEILPSAEGKEATASSTAQAFEKA